MNSTESNVSSKIVVISLTLTTLAVSIFVWWLQSDFKKPKKRMEKDRKDEAGIPSEWCLFGHLTDIALYPLKSGCGIHLNEAEATSLGLKSGFLRDRFFIVYDERGNFITGRRYPKMVLIRVSTMGNGSFNFEAPGNEKLTINVPKKPSERDLKNKKFKCRLWSDKVCGLDAGEEAARWISKLLLSEDSGLRIGYYVPEIAVNRIVEPLNKVYINLTSEDTGAFSDLSAFLLISEDSVAELNSRLSDCDKVSCSNFRPNLLIKSIDGEKPFVEDDWEWCRIGKENGPVFRCVKPCTRCVFTTVNPETGAVNPHKEPLATLKTYRQITDPEAIRMEGKAPVMGVNLGLYVRGSVHIGDPVYVGVQNK